MENSQKPKPKKKSEEEQEILKVRTPKNDREVIGVIEQLLGNRRMRVKCTDLKERLCRIPGKIRERLKLKEGEYVLVQKWEIEGDKKGDVLYRYLPREVEWLKKTGFIKGI